MTKQNEMRVHTEHTVPGLIHLGNSSYICKDLFVLLQSKHKQTIKLVYNKKRDHSILGFTPNRLFIATKVYTKLSLPHFTLHNEVLQHIEPERPTHPHLRTHLRFHQHDEVLQEFGRLGLVNQGR